MTRVDEGWSPSDTDAFLGVHVETVTEWVREHKAGGDGGLAGTPHPNRKPFLTPEQEAEVLSWLIQRSPHFGFCTDLRAATRIAQLIDEVLGGSVPPRVACRCG